MPGADEVLGDIGAEGGVGITAPALVERLDAEVVEERDAVIVADVEEEVDEVRVVFRPPAGRADRVHDGETEDVAVEAHGAGGVEGRKRGVVDTADPVIKLSHEVPPHRSSSAWHLPR